MKVEEHHQSRVVRVLVFEVKTEVLGSQGEDVLEAVVILNITFKNIESNFLPSDIVQVWLISHDFDALLSYT